MRFKLEKILCAVDFSEFSRHVIFHGVSLARKFNARLFIFHAIPSPIHPSPDAPFPILNIEKHAEDVEKKLKDLMENHTLNWEPIITTDDPVAGVLRLVENNNIDLVIAASYGLSGIRRMLTGTVVEQLARSLSRPFWVSHPGSLEQSPRPGKKYSVKRIVVGCDISSDASFLCRYAFYLAHSLQAGLDVVHALESPLNENLINPTQAPYNDVQKRLMHQLERRLAGIIPLSQRNGILLKTSALAGIPGELLRKYAKEIGADLIIIGVKPGGTFKKMLAGSTTETMIRKAPCPVLTIPSVMNPTGHESVE